MRFTTCFILLLQTTLCLAQPPSDYKFQSISIAQGLSQSSAYSVIQDHLGYIWAGTQGGMNRYDGYGVKKFEPISSDSLSIGIGWRTASIEDDKGNIWTGSSRGTISMYNRRDDRWINYKPGFSEEFRKKFPNYQSTNLGQVVQLNLDTLRQKIYISTFLTGLYILDLKTGKFSQHWFPEAIDRNGRWKDNTFISALAIGKDNLLISSGNGLVVFDKNTERFTKRIFKSDDQEKQMFFLQSIKLNDEECILASDRGIVKYNHVTGDSIMYINDKKSPHSISAGQVRSVCLSRDKKTLWAGIDGLGIEILDIKTGKFTHINAKTAPNSGVSGDLYFNIIEDKEGNFWAGSSNTGILKYDPSMKKMNFVLKDEPSEMPLGFSTVWGTFIDNEDNLWVGSLDAGGGITMVDRKNKKSTRFLNDPQSLESRKWVFGQDNTSAIYVMGTSKAGRILYKKAKGEKSFAQLLNLTKQYLEGKLPIAVSQSFFYLTQDGDLITGGDTAILVSDKQGKLQMKAYTPLLKIKDRIKYIFNKGKDKTYILTNKHFWKWNESTGTITNLIPWTTLDPVGLLLMSYADIDEEKTVYLPSFGYGLVTIDLKAKKLTILNQKNGIPSQYLYDVTIDKNGMVWSSSNFGIIRYDPQRKKFKSFFKNDGAQDYEYDALSFSKSKNGEIAFGGLFGANYFIPENIKDNTTPPSVIIQSITKMGKLLNIEDNAYDKEIQIKYNENQLGLEFIAFNYKSPEFNQYAYMMEGYDRDWNYSGGRHFATYTNLPSGKYKFRVKASNNDGVWNEEGATLMIRVHPAPWFSWWAFLIYVSILGFSVRLFVKYRENMQKRKMDNERKNSELQAAKDFQQSMLPKVLPSRNDLEISTFLRSSTEIGGDYYDFFEQQNGDLYVVCGDATGHGIISGMMVSIAKAGLNGISALSPSEILKQLNKVIKKVDLGTMRMSLNIIRIKQECVEMSSAAMPPIYHYVSSTGKTEEIQMSGLPLGGLKRELFETEERDFASGDALVMLSDGLPEAPNASTELFDYKRVQEIIEKNGSKDAESIKNELVAAVDLWLSGENNPDDITIIVIKKK
jgi:serine phosphatase RsbU (regulator of sigma subunit)/ligand-binding sensor domain-containing protein